MKTNKEQENFSISSKIIALFEERHLAGWITAFLGFIYLAGYLVSSIFLRSIGIESASLLKAQYIETGIVFSCFTATIMVVPFYTMRMIRRIKGEEENSFKIGTIITTVVIINFSIVLLYFALFTTHEIDQNISIRGYSICSVGSVFVAYLVVILGISVLVGFIKDKNISEKYGKDPCIMPYFRFLMLTTSIIFDYIIVTQIAWMKIDKIGTVMRFYLFMAGMFGITLFMLVKRLERPFQKPKHRYNLLMFCLFFLVPMFYLMLTAYSSSVYRILPVNRGGKLPVTRATIILKSSETERPLIDIDTNEGAIGPLFIVEQNEEDVYFILDKYPAFGDPKFGKVYAMKKADIFSIEHKKFDTRAFWFKERLRDRK